MDVTKLIFQRIEVTGTAGRESTELLAAAVSAVLASCLDETANHALREAIAASPPGQLERLGRQPLSATPQPEMPSVPLGSERADAIARTLAEYFQIAPATARRAVDRAAALSVAGIAEAGRAQGLDPDESVRMFAKQAGSVALALPARVADGLLDQGLLAGLGGRTRQALAEARPAGGATERPAAPLLPAEPGPAWWRWVIPATAVAVALLIAAMFLRGN